MKNLLLCLIALLIFNISSLAQAPEKFKYQAIITDNKDHPVRNKTIGLEISILQSNLNGIIVYQETFTTRTSNAGLVNLEIGTGMITSGVFSDINWGVGPYYLGIGVDMNGSGNYISMGASQLLSVPYALYAKQAQSVEGDNDTDPTNEIELPEVDGTAGQVLTTDGEGIVSWQTPVETAQNLSTVLTEGNDGDAKQIKNIADPTDPQDAVTKSYVGALEATIAALEARIVTLEEAKDVDYDGFSVDEGDCNDYDNNVYPGAVEVCNNIDDNCNDEIDEDCVPPAAIGDEFQGGIVVYISRSSDNIWRGTVAAPMDNPADATWEMAKTLCDDMVLNGYDDWYLPSLATLNTLQRNKEIIGGFNNGAYWSATDDTYNPDEAWYVYFNDGANSSSNKSNIYDVRAFR